MLDELIREENAAKEREKDYVNVIETIALCNS